MHSVNINRQELLGIVQENKKKHVEAFKESVADYKKAALQIAKDNLALVKTGKIEEIIKVKSMPPKPASFENEYNRAIRMLELSVDEVIELQQDVFNQLVLDEWHWKQAFVSNSTIYKSFSFNS
jgi:hypothetical protein